MKHNIKLLIGAMLGITTLYVTCQSYHSVEFRRNYSNVNTFIHATENLTTKPFLKAHFTNGNVAIFDEQWEFNTNKNTIIGSGKLYDFRRTTLNEGAISIPIDSIVIFETNRPLDKPESARISGSTIVTVMNVFMTGLCIANPKACFGSCPTFYVSDDSNIHLSDAEAFSSAIAPSLEYADIDALGSYQNDQGTFKITMKNEAFETHCIREVAILTAAINSNERIYHSTTNNFFSCSDETSPSIAKTNATSILEYLKKDDHNEWFTEADSENLSAKEEIYLEFKTKDSDKGKGLVLDFRQSLMTSYLIYSAIDYMGNEVGDYFAKIESNKDIKDKLINGIKKELGNIDIYLWDENKTMWNYQGGFNETGPIAINKQILPLDDYSDSDIVKIKIKLNKGYWRIDCASLVDINNQVKPQKIQPSLIKNNNKRNPNALQNLLNSETYLNTFPTDKFEIFFNIPDSTEANEIFLYTKGYYLEWMKEPWVKEKNLAKLNDLVNHPAKYLKEEAYNYKKYENNMEYVFWNSRLDTSTYAIHEQD